MYDLEYRQLIAQLRERLSHRTVVLLFSGGFDSVALLSILLSEGIQNLCDLRILTLGVPSDLYRTEYIASCSAFFVGQGCSFNYLLPSAMIPADIPYDRACPLCKKLRQNAVESQFASMLAEGSAILFLTGHNLDDLSSYVLEMTARSLDPETEALSQRYFENSNKFIPWFEYNDSVTIYRPLIHFTKDAIAAIMGQHCRSTVTQQIPTLKQSCKWLHQRKRILQEYLSCSKLQPEYERVRKAMERIAPILHPSEYAQYPYPSYLM